MQTSFVFAIVIPFLVVLTAAQWQQQWTPQQVAAYHQQQYNNWYWQQQRLSQQQAPATAAPAPSSGVQQHPVFGRVETDDKGNMWVGDDTFKMQIISRYSPPSK